MCGPPTGFLIRVFSRFLHETADTNTLRRRFRAGQSGREFAVITTVLVDIIKEMDPLIHSVVDTSGTRDASRRRGAQRLEPVATAG